MHRGFCAARTQAGFLWTATHLYVCFCLFALQCFTTCGSFACSKPCFSTERMFLMFINGKGNSIVRPASISFGISSGVRWPNTKEMQVRCLSLFLQNKMFHRRQEPPLRLKVYSLCICLFLGGRNKLPNVLCFCHCHTRKKTTSQMGGKSFSKDKQEILSDFCSRIWCFMPICFLFFHTVDKCKKSFVFNFQFPEDNFQWKENTHTRKTT